MERWEFDFLEIPVTKDTREIKRAYAKQVKKYHPEDSPEEWEQLHKAYKAALNYAKYAQMCEEKDMESSSYECEEDERPQEIPEEYSQKQEEVDEEYDWEEELGTIFEDAGSKEECEYFDLDFAELEEEDSWDKIQALKEQIYLLCDLKGEEACSQWRRFLLSEEMREAPAEVLRLILKLVLDNKLEKKVLKILSEVMQTKEQEYFVAMRLPEGRLAGEIAELSAMGRFSRKWHRSEMLRRVVAALVISFVGYGLIFLMAYFDDDNSDNLSELHLNSTEERYIREEIAEYMNEKYQEDYNSPDFVIYEWEEKWVGDRKFDWYLAQVKENKSVKVCVYKKQEEMICFDTVQMWDIAEGIRKEISSLIGYNNFYFSTTMKCANNYYDGDSDKFFEEEWETYCQMGQTTDLERDTITIFAADPNCSTIEERWNLEKSAQELDWKNELIELEDITEQTIVGITMVKEYVPYYLKKAEGEGLDWSDTHIWTRTNSPILEPFITSLYVSSSMEDSRPLKDGDNYGMIESYPRKKIAAGEGIYAFQKNVVKDDMDMETLSYDMKKYADNEIQLNLVEVPESLKLSKAEKKKAISFQPIDHLGEQNEWIFVIYKEQYGIADTGYKVVESQQGRDLGSDDMEITYEDVGEYLVVTVPISGEVSSTNEMSFTVINP